MPYRPSISMPPTPSSRATESARRKSVSSDTMGTARREEFIGLLVNLNIGGTDARSV